MIMNVDIEKLCKDDFLNLLNGNENQIETSGRYKTFFKKAIDNYLRSNNYRCVAVSTSQESNQNGISRMYASKGQFVHLDSTYKKNDKKEVSGEIVVKAENADFMLNLSKYLVEVSENKAGKRGISDYLKINS